MKLKVLCVCQGGNVRSAAMATELKQAYRIDAVAVGYQKNSADTVALLSRWADRIVVMRPDYAASVPAEFQDKVVAADVGEDTYGTPSHPDLRRQVKQHAASLVPSWT